MRADLTAPSEAFVSETRSVTSAVPAALSPTAAAITRYTDPGDLIVDLGCGDGGALVEAIRADRLAIGIERSRRLADKARGAVTRATTYGGPGFAAVVVGELADAPRLVGPDSLGRASLVLVDAARIGVLGQHARVSAAETVERIATAWDVSRVLLRPDGHVLVVGRSELREQIRQAVGEARSFEFVEDHRDAPKPKACEAASIVVMRHAPHGGPRAVR